MTHHIDLTEDWPPAELRQYIRHRTGDISIAVLPRLRPLAGGLVFLSEDASLVALAAHNDITLGIPAEFDEELGRVSEFGLSEVIEFAFGVGSKVTADAIEACIRGLRSHYRRQASVAESRGLEAPALRIAVERVDDFTHQRALIEGNAEEAIDALRTFLEGAAHPDSPKGPAT